MKKNRMSYMFHNPNTAEATAEHLMRILMESNAKKVDQAVQVAAAQDTGIQKWVLHTERNEAVL